MSVHTLWMHVLYTRYCLCFTDFAVLCIVEEAALPLGCHQLAVCWMMTELVLVTLFLVTHFSTDRIWYISLTQVKSSNIIILWSYQHIKSLFPQKKNSLLWSQT